MHEIHFLFLKTTPPLVLKGMQLLFLLFTLAQKLCSQLPCGLRSSLTVKGGGNAIESICGEGESTGIQPDTIIIYMNAARDRTTNHLPESSLPQFSPPRAKSELSL